MASRVLLTIDTELTFGRYAKDQTWQENLACSFDAAGVGVPYQLKWLAAHGLKACFFVDPMPALLYGLEPVRRMVEPILAAGQEVQLHLHSFWAAAADGGKVDTPRELADCPAEAQLHLIRTARDLLIEAGAPPPVAFRSGSYAANDATLEALAHLGIRYDSSHNGSHAPEPSAVSLPRRQIAPVRHRGVVEIPVTQIEDMPGRMRHLQLCAVSAAEMSRALRHASDCGHPVATIVSHSFELATRDGRRVNALLKRRFERLCSFLRSERDLLPTVHFTDLTDLPLDRPAVPLPANRIRTAARMVEQLWGNVRYEHHL